MTRTTTIGALAALVGLSVATAAPPAATPAGPATPAKTPAPAGATAKPGKAPASTKAKPTTASSPAKPAEEPVYDAGMDGQRQLEAAARYCVKSGRRLVLNFGTNDCEPCRVVNRAMHEPKFYSVFVNDFLPVFIDVTPGSKNEAILKRFDADPKKGLPIVVVFDMEMKPAAVTKSGEMKALSRKGKDEIQQFFLAHFPKTGG